MLEQPNPNQTALPPELGSPPARKPSWLRGSQPLEGYPVRQLLKDLRLNTICQEAHCPNIGQCFKEQTATFLLMGRACTRNCRFCRVHAETPDPLDPSEGARVAEAVEKKCRASTKDNLRLATPCNEMGLCDARRLRQAKQFFMKGGQKCQAVRVLSALLPH